MIYLYLKKHNKTGLKYLGKTTQDPFTYRGSGVYWKNHIKKYGNDVTTEILFQSNDIQEIKKQGLKFSEKWNVVDSKDFANLMEENGVGGKTKTSFKKGHIPYNKGQTGKKNPLVSQYWINWREQNPDYKSKWKCNQRAGISDEVRENRRNDMIVKNKTKVECPHCNKTGNIANMKRWHMDNCKFKTT